MKPTFLTQLFAAALCLLLHQPVSAEPQAPALQNFAATGQPADYRAVFARRKDHSTAGLTYSVQFSADLGLWTPSATAPTLQTGAGSAGSMEVVSVPFPASVPLQVSGSAPPKFFRVAVSEN